MAKRKTHYIMFKLPGHPWVEYDRTQSAGWAETQRIRCEAEKAGAEVKVEVK